MDETTYEIRRFFKDPDKDYEVILDGLTLEEAQAHCERENTHTEEWFDGYSAE